MPRIGSHSSGGSFSHSRGGSSSRSFGGGSFSGGGHHHHRPRGPRVHVFLGRRYYGNSGAFSIFFIIMLFALFFSIPFWVMQADVKNELQYLKKDFAYYQELADSGTQYEATVKSYEAYQVYEGTNYYYITFEVDYSVAFPNRFETTATYTMQQATALYNLGKITVCCNGSNAIQADFDINTDKEYAYELQKIEDSTASSRRIALILTFVGAGFGVIGFVVFIKSMKKVTENSEIPYEEQNSPEIITTTTTNTAPKEEASYCSYCGSRLKAGDTKCKDCGARAKK